MNNVVQYAQDIIGMSCHSQYAGANRAVLGWCVVDADCMAGVAGMWFISTGEKV